MAIIPVPNACSNCGGGGGTVSDVCVVCDVTIGAILTPVTVLQGTSPWVVSGTVTVNQGTSPWVVTSASNYAEDSPHTSGDIGNFVLAVRNDANAVLTSTNLDYSPFSVTSTGALNIADAGGSITVDGTVTALQGTSPWVVSGTVAATQSGAWTVTANQGTSPWVVSGTVTALQGTSPWVVSGTVTSTAAFQYAEDSPHTSGDIGAFVLAVRNDANAVLTSTNLDYSPFSVTSTGALNIADAGGSITVDGTVTALQGTSPWVVSGTVAATQSGAWTVTANQGTSPWVVSGTVTATSAFQYAEDSPHVSGDIGAFVLAVRNDANAILTSTNGDYSPFSVTSTGALNIADAGGSITVDGTVTVLQGTSPWIVSGTVTATNASNYAEDSPHVSGDIGNFVLAVRNDANAVLTSTNGDYSPFSVTSTGALNIADAGGSITVDGTVTANQGTSPWVVSGTVTANQGTSPWVVSGTVTAVGTDTAADAHANPTTALIADAYNSVFNGTTWDRMRSGTALGSVLVNNPTAANLNATVFQGTSPWVVSGTVTSTAAFQYAEDAPHTSGDIGAFVLAVRNDANAVLTSTNLDYSPFSVTSTGALNIADAGGSITVDGTVTANQGTSPWVVSGTVTANQGTSPWVVSGTVTAVGTDTAADAHANPTTALIADAYNSVFNGTTWDRMRSGTALGSVLVNNPTAANFLATVTQGTSPWVVSGTITTNYERAEDSAHTSGQIGAFVLAVRNDANAVLTDTNLDYSPFSVTSTGALNIADAGGSITVDGTVTVNQGTSPWVVSLTSTTITGTVSVVGTDTAADAHANPTTAIIADTYNSVFNGTTWDRMRSGTALGSVLVNNPTAANFLATVTAGAEKAEDSGHTSGQTGNFILGVRNDTQAVLTSTDLDYSPIAVDSAGRVQVVGSLSIGGTARDDTDDQAVVATGAGLQVVRNYLFDGTNWDRMRSVVGLTDANAGTGLQGHNGYTFNGTTWDRVRSGGVTGMQGVAGAEAHDAAITGNPVLMGAYASGVLPTPVSTDGDATRLWNTKNGALHVYPSRRRRQGIYHASLGASTVTLAADAATGGRWWLQNPVGATKTLAVRKIYFSMTTGTGLLVTTAPIFTVERFSFTGTASGATITPAKRDSGDTANTGTIRTASTGMTITAGAAAHGFQVPAALATTSQNTNAQVWPNGQDEDEWITLLAGEGIVIRQSTAGTLADTRVVNMDITWEEFNTTDYGIRD